MRPVLSAAFFLMACVGVDKPNVPTTENPLPTPAPTPVPAPAPVPQPSYTPPPASTPLVDVPSISLHVAASKASAQPEG